MIKSVPFANAATIVTIAASVICWLLTLVAPDLVFGIANSWFHMINLNAVRIESSATFGEALMGFVSLGVVTWVVAYVFTECHNYFAKGK